MGADADEHDAARSHDAAWWTKPSRRLPILLAILAAVAWYGIPRIGQGAAHASACSGRARSEPRNRAADRTYVIQDAFASGTWARSDPCDGIFYAQHRPPNARRWVPNRDQVTVDCARIAAPYTVRFTNGSLSVWSTWLHTRDGMWVQRIVAWEAPRDGSGGLPVC